RSPGVEPERAPGLGARRGRRPVPQRMAHERRRDSSVTKKLLLERQDHGQAPHRREPAHATRPPGPHLGSDVIQHGDSRLARGRRRPEMVTRIVDEDGEVVALGPEGVADAAQQAEVRRELPQCFDEPNHGESLHAVEYDGAGGFQIRPAERLHGRGGEATLERGHDGRGVRVPRRLAGGDVNPRRAAHGRVAAWGTAGAGGGASGASGEACTAAATRNARARARAPAAPDTTTSSSPRTARTKLSSSSRSGSASGASRRTCSTICSSVVGPRPCQPGFKRKKSPLPCARSSEQYPVGWKMRSLRVRSRDTRLAVRFAMAPLANSMRAFTMSTWGVRIATPVARTSVAGARTSSNTRSRSWIIRSRITATSVPRGWKGASRSICRNRGSSR